MFDRKEAALIIVISIILAFTISLIETTQIFLYTLLAVFMVILANILAKKIMAYYLESEIKIKLWEIKRVGLLHMFWRFKRGGHPSHEFKKPFPAGAFLPIIITAFTFGYIKWMACLVFDVKTKVYRAAKRHGLYAYSEMPEYHIGLIAAAGILANLLFAIIGYLIGYPLFAKLNIYYASYNIIPLSDLDGNKLFFGSKLLWNFLVTLTIIALVLSFMI